MVAVGRPSENVWENSISKPYVIDLSIGCAAGSSYHRCSVSDCGFRRHADMQKQSPPKDVLAAVCESCLVLRLTITSPVTIYKQALFTTLYKTEGTV